MWLVHLAHILVSTSVCDVVVLAHPTSHSLLVWYTPPGQTVRKCTPGIDELYISTPPTPPSTLAFPLSLRSSWLFSPRLAPGSDLPTSTSLQDPRLSVEVLQQNVKPSPGPPRRVMVPLVLLVHPDPPWSTFSVKFEKVWIRMDQSGPVGPREHNPPWWTRRVQDHQGSRSDIFLMRSRIFYLFFIEFYSI